TTGPSAARSSPIDAKRSRSGISRAPAMIPTSVSRGSRTSTSMIGRDSPRMITSSPTCIVGGAGWAGDGAGVGSAALRPSCSGGGWLPQHLTLWRAGKLGAAAPAYIKADSDGDFSRDWGWAEAAARARIAYYPKLVLTVPFTPVGGRRLHVAAGEDRAVAIRT